MAAIPSNSSSDNETRQSLLNAAAALFAERGFTDVTVREICAKAGVANAAAVNYYFRDKAGLYRELLESLVARWVENREQYVAALGGKPPEEKLYLCLRWFLGNILGENEDEKEVLFGKILNREMVEPTPELSIVVEKGMRPNFKFLAEIIAEVLELPLDSPVVQSCTMSTMGQCLIYGSARKMAKYFISPAVQFTPEVIDRIAHQVASFSLAGMRATAAEAGRPAARSDAGDPERPGRDCPLEQKASDKEASKTDR
jgi:TetR/AcrR family transcriptional regulator, regulator of cefoperazone and chloramphenicol sensitivity